MRGVGIWQSRDQLDAPVPDSAGVGILRRILEILLFQPFPFLFGLGDIDPLDLEAVSYTHLVESPTAFLLGGQPGSGKTSLRRR